MLDKAILSGLAAKVILSGMAAKTILNGFAAKVILSGLGRSTFMRARTYTFNFLSFKATPKYAKVVIGRLNLKKCTHAFSHCNAPALAFSVRIRWFAQLLFYDVCGPCGVGQELVISFSSRVSTKRCISSSVALVQLISLNSVLRGSGHCGQ